MTQNIHTSKLEMESKSIPVFPPIGMSPSIWGPYFWNAMHIATLGYPDIPNDADKSAAGSFFESLARLIPCPICRSHYSEFLKSDPPQVESRTTLVYWLYNIHNKVNQRLEKPLISFSQFIDQMRNLNAPAASRPSIGLFVTGLLIGAGAFYAFHKYK